MSARNELQALLLEMIEEDLGLSIEGFARKMNTSAGTVRRWLSGEVNDPFLLLQTWNVAPERFRLRLLPFIGRSISEYGDKLRRQA